MDYGTQIEIATISLWNYGAIILNVIASMILYMKAKRSASLNAFFLVQFSMLIWLIGKVFKTVAPTEEIRWLAIVFYYFGIMLLEVSFLDFAYIYYKGKALNKHLRIALYFLGLIQYMVVFTNPYHHLFYSEYDFWGDEFGVLFYVNTAIYYIFIVIGMVYCSRKFKKQFKPKGKKQQYIISVAILAPLVLNFVYITRILERIFYIFSFQIFDITPIVFTSSLVIFVFATFKYEFFDITPIMKHEITYSLDAPILIIDSDGRMLYVNEQLNHTFDISGNKAYMEGLIKKGIFFKNNGYTSSVQYKGHYFRYNITLLKGIGGKRYIIAFNDITAYQRVKDMLFEKNKELNAANIELKLQIEILKQTSHIGARNYVARELHDIIGHSLVVTMKLLEVAKIFHKKNQEQFVLNNLDKAVASINNGFEEMKKLTQKDTAGAKYNFNMLKQELKYMLNVVEAGGTKVDFYARGENRVIDRNLFDIIKKVSTELVTNALKHSRAGHILLYIIIKKENISIRFMDNGIGCKDIKKGSGLNGIESRLALVGGYVSYQTGEREGFIVNIEISN